MTKVARGETRVDRLIPSLAIQRYSSIFPLAETLPFVDNIGIARFINTTPVTVTRFLGGEEGQIVKILGDGNTTIAHYAGTLDIANQFKIRTNTAANKLLAADIVYTLTCFSIDGKLYWFEEE